MSPGPIFIGGTGRCGTTVLGQLIGSHRDYTMIPFEVRFHADQGGMPDLLAGDVTLDEFLESMRTKWGSRNKNGEVLPNRFRDHISEDQMEAALQPFAASFPADPPATSRELVCALLDPMARDAGKPAWVEMTPSNARSGQTLATLFPGMRLVHIVRDGRDVASAVASAMERTRGRKGRVTEQRSVAELIRKRWEQRLRLCEAGCANLSPDELLVLHFEDLLVKRREESYRRLLEFLELDDDPGMRAYFDTEMPPDRAHIGRWRQGRSEAEQEWINDVYATVLDGLRQDGVSCATGFSTELEKSRIAVTRTKTLATRPTFLIIGAQKSGTRWLRRNLGEHPEIFTADHECAYFNDDLRFERGLQWYRKQFTGWDGEEIVGEATPSYLMWKPTSPTIEEKARRIDEQLSGVKLIAILRNPVDRLYSAFIHHMLHKRIAPDADLLEVVARKAPKEPGLRLVMGGMYGESLKPFVARFRDRLQVVLQDDAKREPERLYRGALEHVGADPGFMPPDLTRIVHSYKPPRGSPYAQEDGRRRPLTAEEREVLFAYFADDIAELESLIDRDLSVWRP